MRIYVVVRSDRLMRLKEGPQGKELVVCEFEIGEELYVNSFNRIFFICV
jgi:hypothetical protein